MKMLVTGGAGFIGSNLVRLLLQRGHAVRVLDNLSTGYAANLEGLRGVEFVKGDILDADAVRAVCQGMDVVFHMAAAVGNVRSVENPVFDSEVNVLGTLRVLEAARLANIQKVVFSSSAAIFGEPVRLPIDEDHPVAPDSPYGVSKLAAEKHCLCYNKLYGMNNVCLRYFNVYGCWQRYDAYGNVIPIFLTKLQRKEPLIIYGDGEQTRDFINVEDVAMANCLAAETADASGPINVGTGETITINMLADLIRKLGIDGRIEYRPARKGEVLHSRAAIDRLRTQLKFSPNVAVADGLQKHAAWLAGLEPSPS